MSEKLEVIEDVLEDLAEITKIGLLFTVEHVNSLHTVKFREQLTHTVQQLWDHSYTELNEHKREGDKLQTQDGKDLTPYLQHTVLQAFIHGELKTRKLEIIGPTGGA